MPELFTAGFGPLLCLLDEGETAEKLWAASRRDFTLLALGAADWERELSPWPAPPLRAGDGGFSGGGPAFLERLTGEALPRAEVKLGYVPPARGIVGYSLAGLFALYALLESDAFTLAASVSGSLWYDGWTDFLAGRTPPAGRRVYLSLGRKEAKGGGARLRAVAENTRRTAEFFSAGGPCTLEWNPGGHFTEPEARLGRALAWLTARETEAGKEDTR